MAVSRRSFLKGSAVTAAVAMAGGQVAEVLGKTAATMTPGPGNTLPGKVVINFNKDAVILNAAGNPEVDATVVKAMVDDAIQFLTEKTTVAEAWRSLFPATLTAPPTIAIKVPVGFASKRMVVPWQSIKAIIDGLTLMEFGGTKLPAGNITVYEAKSQMLSSEKFSSNGYTATNLPGVKIVFDSDSTGATDGAKSLQYAKSLSAANYLINVFRAGGHMAMFENLTLGFKNHFGTYAVDHTDKAPAYIRDINCTGAVFNKNVLSICMGLFGADEGPGQPGDPDKSYATYVKTVDSVAARGEPRTIMMSTDPVSVEMQTIKMMRQNKGKSFLTKDLPNYLKSSGGETSTLSGTTYNIGVIDEAKMEIKKIINGQRIGVAIGTASSVTHQNTPYLHVSPLVNHRSTFVEYGIPQGIVGSQAEISVFDLKGNVVFSDRQNINGVKNSFSWNERNGHEKQVPNGTYVVVLTAATLKLSRQFSLLR